MMCGDTCCCIWIRWACAMYVLLTKDLRGNMIMCGDTSYMLIMCACATWEYGKKTCVGKWWCVETLVVASELGGHVQLACSWRKTCLGIWLCVKTFVTVLEVKLCAHAQPSCSPDLRLLYCVGIIMIMCGDTCQLHLNYVGMRRLCVRLKKDCCIAWE